MSLFRLGTADRRQLGGGAWNRGSGGDKSGGAVQVDRSWVSAMSGRRLRPTCHAERGPCVAEWLVETVERATKPPRAGHHRFEPVKEPELHQVIPSVSASMRRSSSPLGGAAGIEELDESGDGGAEDIGGTDAETSGDGRNGSPAPLSKLPVSLLGAPAGAVRRMRQKRRVKRALPSATPLVGQGLVETSYAQDAAGSKGAMVPLPLEEAATGFIPAAKAMASPLRSRAHGVPDTTLALQEAGSPDRVCLMLPRIPARRKLDVGKVTTTHTSQEGESLVLMRRLPGRSRSPQRPALSGRDQDDLPQDRKWHIRQASLSASLAQTKMVGIKEAPQTDSDDGGASVAPQREYLCFDNWGVDDKYICSLMGSVELGHMRHINMAGNRLTESFVAALVARAKSQSLSMLESLRLSQNRLEMAGGVAIANLVCCYHPPLQQLDLADNNLGDVACEQLCDALVTHCPSLVGLSLAQNNIGTQSRGGEALGALVGSMINLQALDLHWNRLQGVGAAALLESLYENACRFSGQLWRVNLAWNRFGRRCKGSQHSPGQCRCEACRGCDRCVAALCRVFSEGKVLFHLDLSYNSFQAGDCQLLGAALRGNHTLYGLHFAGNSACVDDVGFLVVHGAADVDREQGPEHLQEEANVQRIRNDVDRWVRNTPHRLRLEKFSHFTNDGGAGPIYDKAKELALHVERTNPSIRSAAREDAFAPEELEAEKKWVSVHAKVRRPADFGWGVEESCMNEHMCWICENWVQEIVQYIPGWSGPEQDADEVTEVFAFFGIDGFTRPVRLARTFEQYDKELFAGARSRPTGPRFRRIDTHRETRQLRTSHVIAASPVGNVEETTRAPIVDENGKYVVFRGSRMLPPSLRPMHVVFQVNDVMVTADHLTKEPLDTVSILKVHRDGRASGQPLSSLPDMAVPRDASIEVKEANVICVGTRAWQRFTQGMANCLCLMEDPRHRGELEVAPRKLQYADAPRRTPVVRDVWKFETSMLGGFTLPTARIYINCFDHDYAASKLPRLMRKMDSKKGAGQESMLCDYLRANYKGIVAAFHRWAFDSYEIRSGSAGLTLVKFTCALSLSDTLPLKAAESSSTAFRGTSTSFPRRTPSPEVDDSSSSTSKPVSKACTQDTSEPWLARGPMEQVFTATFQTSYADSVYIGSLVIDKSNKMVSEMKALPALGMARFQFLEAFVRVAFSRYSDILAKRGPVVAVRKLTEVLGIGEDFLQLRDTLYSALFNEESCIIMRQNRRVLEDAFELFGKRLRHHGRYMHKVMTYAAWVEFLLACKAPDWGLPPKLFGVAFALARELRVDEFTTLRHMELNWNEFLVAIGAVVRLSRTVDLAGFEDGLEEFIEESIAPSVHALQAAARTSGRPQPGDPELNKLTVLITEVFKEADWDGSGELAREEFLKSFSEPKTQQKFEEFGLEVKDFKLLFLRIDADKSGTVTLDELVEGFKRMRKALAGLERVTAFLYKVFEEGDSDNSGFLSRQEFYEIFRVPVVINKLEGFGVSAEDIDDLWAAVDAVALDTDHPTETEGICAEHIVAAFLGLREPGSEVLRGINYMRQIFVAADSDKDGKLSRKEVEDHFTQECVRQKLEALRLVSAKILEIFDAIDINGDGVLSWEELHSALVSIWAEQ